MTSYEKIKIRLVGNNFSHTTGGNKGYSTHGKVSKYMQWDDNSDISIYLDENIRNGIDDRHDGIKYGWLIESKFITPEIINDVQSNFESYFETYNFIFTHNRQLTELDPRFKWVPATGFWIEDPRVYEKNKMISMISSNKRMCSGHLERLVWVEILKSRVDLYGRGFNEIDKKEEGLCDYMFSVAIENGCYETYFTEKILDCFATGTIPIYMGAPDIGRIFNPEGIIQLSENFEINEEIYFDKIKAVKENLEIVKTMELVEDYMYKIYLEPSHDMGG